MKGSKHLYYDHQIFMPSSNCLYPSLLHKPGISKLPFFGERTNFPNSLVSQLSTMSRVISRIQTSERKKLKSPFQKASLSFLSLSKKNYKLCQKASLSFLSKATSGSKKTFNQITRCFFSPKTQFLCFPLLMWPGLFPPLNISYQTVRKMGGARVNSDAPNYFWGRGVNPIILFPIHWSLPMFWWNPILCSTAVSTPDSRQGYDMRSPEFWRKWNCGLDPGDGLSPPVNISYETRRQKKKLFLKILSEIHSSSIFTALN